MIKVGLVFGKADLEIFRENGGFDLLILPPSFNITLSDCEALTAIRCISLSSFIEIGEISSFSRQIAPVIRELISRIKSISVESESSQGDLYNYHLRLQWLYVIALDRYFEQSQKIDLWLAIQPYQQYYSPMRPDQGVFYSNDRLFAYLASDLAKRKGIRLQILKAQNLQILYVKDTILKNLRKIVFNLFLVFKLLEKVIRAKIQSNIKINSSNFSLSKPVGIIVRTDSEVISASFLVKILQNEGIPYLIIQDEVLASSTTHKRMKSFGYEGVSIGSMTGFKGVLSAWMSKKAQLSLTEKDQKFEPSLVTNQVLLQNNQVLNHLKNRLNDFHSIQYHFRMELHRIIDIYKIGILVTFSYVDHWGGVIKAAGNQFGIKTLAIQNAAQDPEEFPKLCWADIYCVESMHLKKTLVFLGYPENKIIGTGLPHFSSFDPQLFEKKLTNIPKKRLLILAQPIYQTYFELIINACAEFAKKNNIDLAIKYHPRQQGNEYEKIIKFNTAKTHIQVYTSESLDELIINSSAVISIVSAALIRSINIGTPTISFLPLELRYLDLYYSNDENLYRVETINELIELLWQMEVDAFVFQKCFQAKRLHYLKEHACFEPADTPERNIISTLLAERSK
jgi:hypothetical protein